MISLQVRRTAKSRRRPASRRLPLLFGIVVIMGLLLLGLLNGRIKPVLETVGLARARAVANASIMRAVEEELRENAADYQNLVTIERGPEGEVSAVMRNIVKINQLKARISQRVQESLSLDLISVSIPLGNLIGGDLFSGRGPAIPFRLLPYGSVSVDVGNEFVSAGINQSLHRIVLTVKAGLSIVLPVTSVTATVESGVVVAETIIVGDVPERYASYDPAALPAEALLTAEGE